LQEILTSDTYFRVLKVFARLSYEPYVYLHMRLGNYNCIYIQSRYTVEFPNHPN